MISRRRLAGVDLVSSECFDCVELFGHGFFQRWIFFLTVVSMCALHCHTLVFRLISSDVDHWCKRPDIPGLSAATWRNVAIPLGPDGHRSHCTVYVHPGDANDTRITLCYSWDYDPERERCSIVSHWDMVCDRRVLKNLAQAVYVAGSLVFMSCAGYVADNIGRMPVIFSAVAILAMATLGGCSARTYATFLVSRFLNSGCAATVAVLSCTLLFEVSTHKNRSMHVSAAVTAGMILAELWFALARLLRLADWILQQIFMLSPTVLTLFAFSAVHESPRWHVARKDMLRAEMVVVSAAKENHFSLDATFSVLNRLKAEVARNEARLQLDRDANVAKTRRLQRCVFVMFGSYFSAAFTMFTILQLESSVSSTAGAWYDSVSNASNTVAFALLYTALAAFRGVPARRLLVGALAVLGVSVCVTSLSYATGARAVCAALLSALRRSGREDLLFALAGLVVFAALLAQLFLPLPADHLTQPQAFVTIPKGMDYMKQTLDPPVPQRKPQRKASVFQRKPSEIPARSKAGSFDSNPSEIP
ncbi:solute carrier family 22 member 8 [Dermacentor silvarum]|uniref:solute carrier family 22 member 8 n=1 Tax=Dermacentor silvarum TaxID=543639 RepID=UPI001899B6A8|nr:solute carrier family 22 member 8 [Dermacentor silvarum]